jgi:hypothetical protein
MELGMDGGRPRKEEIEYIGRGKKGTRERKQNKMHD